MEESGMTESLPKVRCTPELREELVAYAQASVSTDLADHIREAVSAYVQGRVLMDTEKLDRVADELADVHGVMSLSRIQAVEKLIQYWDTTKRDSYGFQRFS